MNQEANSYYLCMKCNVMLPCYAKEIHATECHALNFHTFSHPIISGQSLLGQALLMSNQSSLKRKNSLQRESSNQSTIKNNKNTSKAEKVKEKGVKRDKSVRKTVDSDSKAFLEEPDWMKKILPGFHYRIVVMNELDMIRCSITAYAPVLLEHNNNKCAFIAMPDTSVQIGHVMLHTAGCLQYLPSITMNSFVWIKRIDEVRAATQVLLTPKKKMSTEQTISMESHLKNIMLSSYPLGSPFTVTVGSVIYPYAMSTCDSQSFTVVNCLTEGIHQNTLAGEDRLLETMANLNLSDNVPETVHSENKEKTLHSDKFQQSHCNESGSFINNEYIAVDEYKEGDPVVDVNPNQKRFITSTPQKCGSESEVNIFKSPLMTGFSVNKLSLVSEEQNMSSICNSIQGENSWFRVDSDSEIKIKSLLHDVSSENVTKAEKKSSYCKDSIYHVLMKIMQVKIKNARAIDNPFLSGWTGVLLYGPPGTGKTLLVNEIAGTLNISLVILTLADVTKASGCRYDLVRHKFKVASERAPSVLFIDELDSLCPAGDHRVSRDQDLTQAVINGIIYLKTSKNPVLLIAATNRIEGVSMKIRCSGRFDKEVLVALPNAQQRAKILHYLLTIHHHNLSDQDITEIAKCAYGFSGSDLDLLLKCAWFQNVQKRKACSKPLSSKPCLCKEDVQEGMAGVVPTMLREDFQAISLVKWNDIYGYNAVKLKLQKMIHLHIAEPDNHPLKGILFYGPPGCSKTMFVKAIVNETGFSFFPIKCSDLLSKYVGETEKSLNRIFGRAQQTAPSIIFMDEVDSLCSDRANGSRLVSELLSAMSEAALHGNILVIGATNRPFVLDEALLKPGCLEQVIHIDLPDYECRVSIWQGILKDIPLEGDVCTDELSHLTEGYSGAELACVYQNAAQAVITHLSKNECQRGADQRITMSRECLLKAITDQQPRTPSLLLESIEEFSLSRTSLSVL
ncbi:Vacuolar protein sorting-associated protein 4A [Halocaridina rubra]|uniref:Vacuolar protein sorting-associated protein 4A n=1 Tax=Halocaridina rubra TaxID=373956 RepID=A0AAN9A8J4_HALRR